MNLLLTVFLWLIIVICALLTLYSCIKTYRRIIYQKRQRHLWKHAHENRGKIGEAQEWQCWECHTVMLTSYQVIVYNNSLIAVCMRCSQGEKYQHIYNQGKGIKDSLV